MQEGYRSEAVPAEPLTIRESLDEVVREGARRMLAAALEEEVTGFLGRGRYERGKPLRGSGNGTLPARELTVGVSAVEVRVTTPGRLLQRASPDHEELISEVVEIRGGP